MVQNLELLPSPVSEGEAIFVQMSDQILTAPAVGAYHREAYASMNGYYFPNHYMEIPFWIPLAAGMMPDEQYTKSLHVVTDVEASIVELSTRPDATLLFSVMEANRPHVRQMLERLGNTSILGGYVDPSQYDDIPHARYLDSLDQLPEALAGLNPTAPPDYRLFAGERCIPRLTMSTGCNFKCRFCTVPLGVNALDEASVAAQVDSFHPLDFKLLYLDDKSFGQASNWDHIKEVKEQVQAYNPDFMGFIAQTPPTLAIRDGFLEEAIARGLHYLETGVETVNDTRLAELKKPYRLRHLNELCSLVRKLGLPLIPNFIFGLPDDNYQETINWVEKNKDIIPVVNVSFAATHFGSERGGLPYGSGSIEDNDQNSTKKSWLSPLQEIEMMDALSIIYGITRGANEGKVWHGN